MTITSKVPESLKALLCEYTIKGLRIGEFLVFQLNMMESPIVLLVAGTPEVRPYIAEYFWCEEQYIKDTGDWPHYIVIEEDNGPQI